MRAIELFAGAGGLGIGVSRAGFSPAIIVERDRWCCDTLRANQTGFDWPEPTEGDIRDVNFTSYEGKVELVTGGPPCQPFSLGGKHRAHADRRDMWSEAVRVIRETRPKAFVFENVRGLARQSFAAYLGYIIHQLQHPSLARRDEESWEAHLERLQQHHTSGAAVEYRVVFSVLDAADYGVAQRRHRIVFVGYRDGFGGSWTFPRATHSAEALTWSQRRGGEYWDRHSVATKCRSYAVGGSPWELMAHEALRWLTVRDALEGLPDPRLPHGWRNHNFQPGAKAYPGHTGSPVDAPAKALKAGVHGVPGGENMMRLPDGEVRYFTVREAARLQAFPDNWLFHGAWSEAMRQLGNAVPVTLGEVVAKSVRTHLDA